MNGFQILDVLIGLCVIYFMLSLFCSAVRESIETVLRHRSKDLQKGIEELLSDPAKIQQFYEHPLISSLYSGKYGEPDTKLPSYIPSKNFATAVLGILNIVQVEGKSLRETLNAALQDENPEVKKLNDALRSIALATNEGADQLNSLVTGLQGWYDSSMDRVSGWYKRRTQRILLGLGLAVSVVLNINTFALTDFLYQNTTAREAIVAKAEGIAKTAPSESNSVESTYKDIQSLKIPIGWQYLDLPQDTKVTGSVFNYRTFESGDFTNVAGFLAVLKIFGGWVISGFAISLGAPFWFDMLNKIMVVRSTVKPKEKSPEEPSKS